MSNDIERWTDYVFEDVGKGVNENPLSGAFKLVFRLILFIFWIYWKMFMFILRSVKNMVLRRKKQPVQQPVPPEQVYPSFPPVALAPVPPAAQLVQPVQPIQPYQDVPVSQGLKIIDDKFKELEDFLAEVMERLEAVETYLQSMQRQPQQPAVPRRAVRFPAQR